MTDSMTETFARAYVAVLDQIVELATRGIYGGARVRFTKGPLTGQTGTLDDQVLIVVKEGDPTMTPKPSYLVHLGPKAARLLPPGKRRDRVQAHPATFELVTEA